jgi:hypothetical protein
MQERRRLGSVALADLQDLQLTAVRRLALDAGLSGYASKRRKLVRGAGR